MLGAKAKSFLAIVLVTVFLVVLTELLSWVFLKLTHQATAPLFFRHVSLVPCETFALDLQLGEIHDDTAGCVVRQGRVQRGFVYYPYSRSVAGKRVVALGGSTTDGYLQYADGFSWPYWLSSLCERCEVINGGVAGFSSSRELLKMVRDVTLLTPSPALVISLNGINDIYNYDGALELQMPYYRPVQLQMLSAERFISIGTSASVLPNTRRVLEAALAHLPAWHGTGKYKAMLPIADLKSKGALWRRNVTLMRDVAHSIGARYLVFVQPALGLYADKNEKMGQADRALLGGLSDDYVRNLNKTFSEIREQCRTLDFCVDISAVLNARADDLYRDPRHPNKSGNRIIAETIYHHLKGDPAIKNSELILDR